MEKKTKITKEIKINKLLKVELIIILICLLLGTLLHFTYELSGKNILIASFSAVNESVWEHLKLAFFPMLIMSIVEYPFVKKLANNYIEAKTIGIFIAISFIVISFFTYTGILGVNIGFFNIVLFIISIILGELTAYKLMRRKNESDNRSKILASAIIVFLTICFIPFTYFTPKLNLFRDPITGKYGISNIK